MTGGFPPADLICPDEGGCPVPPVDLAPWTKTVVAAGRSLFRCYEAARGYDEPNPGYGDARFSPFDSLDGQRVPTIYLAADDTAALLETVFHEVHHRAGRVIYQSHLNGRLLAQVLVPKNLTLVDLRDAELARVRVARAGLVATSAEHYPCTRRWAQAFQATGAHGLIWHSRQAELLGADPVEVAVVFADHYGVGRGGWQLARPGVRALYDGPGRDRVEEIAVELTAVIEMD